MPSLGKFYLLAITFHLLTVLFFFLAGVVQFPWDSNLEPKILQASVRVNVVAMPTLTPEELKEIKMPATDQPTEMVEKKAKKSNFDDMLKSFSDQDVESIKLEKKKPKQKKQTGQKQIDPKLQRLILAGNKLSQGRESYGDQREIDYDELDLYSVEVRDQIHPYWQLPSHLLNEDLQCVVQVFIDAQGNLKGYKIHKSSGKNEFDERALAAIEQAAPFSPPKNEILSALKNGNLLLVFPF